MKTVRGLLWIGLLATSLTSAVAKDRIESRWLDREVTVDGLMNEWQDVMVKPGPKPATLGVMNDGTHLYVCLKSWDRRVNFQAMSRGLILRLAPKGKGNSGVGIRFPVGFDDPDRQRDRRGRPGERDREGRTETPAALEASLTVVEILESGKQHGQRLPVDPMLGFLIHADLHEGMLTYELKIPLKSSTDEPYALGAEPGKTMTLTFETPKIELKALSEHGGSMGGGRGGMSGGRGSGGGGRGPGGMRGGGGPGVRAPEGLKIKAKILLATHAESR